MVIALVAQKGSGGHGAHGVVIAIISRGYELAWSLELPVGDIQVAPEQALGRLTHSVVHIAPSVTVTATTVSIAPSVTVTATTVSTVTVAPHTTCTFTVGTVGVAPHAVDTIADGSTATAAAPHTVGPVTVGTTKTTISTANSHRAGMPRSCPGAISADINTISVTAGGRTSRNATRAGAPPAPPAPPGGSFSA